LRTTNGRIQEAASQVLGMSRQTLWRKIKHFAIQPFDWTNDSSDDRVL
jgi:transcriptional regulator of acetoin/glycerol metabolism